MRLFVALDTPPEVREALRETMERLRPEARGAKWVKPEGMHITLKFIGHVNDEKADAIRAALRAVHSADPVDMRFRGLGFFPNERRPRVLWCGVKASANLAELAANVEQALAPLGIEREARAFAPHLTLARLGEGGDFAKLVRTVSELIAREFGSARETEFHLYESKLKPSGAEYRRVESYGFVKAAT